MRALLCRVFPNYQITLVSQHHSSMLVNKNCAFYDNELSIGPCMCYIDRHQFWKFWKWHDWQIKKNACRNAYLGSIFIPEKYVFMVCFESPFTKMISRLKYKWLLLPPNPLPLEPSKIVQGKSPQMMDRGPNLACQPFMLSPWSVSKYRGTLNGSQPAKMKKYIPHR